LVFNHNNVLYSIIFYSYVNYDKFKIILSNWYYVLQEHRIILVIDKISSFNNLLYMTKKINDLLYNCWNRNKIIGYLKFKWIIFIFKFWFFC